MSIQAEDILLNMKAIETLKGGWLIEVQSVSETQGSDCFLVNAILEQRVISMSSARERLQWRMAVVLANVDYFEELSARLAAGATSGEEAVVLTQADLTNLRKLADIQVLVLKDQLEGGFSSATKEA